MWSWLATAYATCDELGQWLEHAQLGLSRIDVERTEAALARAESSWTCGWMSERRAELARFWLLEGAVLHLRGERQAASESFVASRRTDLDGWWPELGPQIHLAYRTATAEPDSTGVVAVEGLDPHYRVEIDGLPFDPNQSVTVGLHLLQVGTDDHVRFARIIYVLPGATTTLTTSLPLLPPTLPVRAASDAIQFAPDSPPPAHTAPPKAPTRLHGYLAVTVAGSVGAALERSVSDTLSILEPAQKLRAGGEAGLSLRGPRAWGRLAAGLGPLLNSELQYLGRTGIVSLPWAASASLAAGPRWGRVDVGGAAGWLTGRTTASAVASVGFARTLRAEARLGTAWRPGSRPEPDGALVMSWTPGL